MVGVRRASAYSKKIVTPYTRKSKVKSKNYIKAVPAQKIVKFEMGNINGYKEGIFKHRIKLISEINVLVRDLALEAVRQDLQNRLQKELINAYYLSCRVFPHQVLR